MFHANYLEFIINLNCTAPLVILDKIWSILLQSWSSDKISLYDLYQFSLLTFVYRSSILGINIHTVLPGTMTHCLSVISKIQPQHVPLIFL